MPNATTWTVEPFTGLPLKDATKTPFIDPLAIFEEVNGWIAEKGLTQPSPLTVVVEVANQNRRFVMYSKMPPKFTPRPRNTKDGIALQLSTPADVVVVLTPQQLLDEATAMSADSLEDLHKRILSC